MIGHRLSAVVSDEELVNLGSYHQDVAAAGRTDGVACSLTLTVSYTGSDPGGVVSWNVVANNDPWVAQDDQPSATAPGYGPCDPSKEPLAPITEICVEAEAMSEAAAPLRIVSQGATSIVLDVRLRHHNVAGGLEEFVTDPLLAVGFFHVDAVTASGRRESKTFMADCSRVVPVNDHGRLPVHEGYRCPAYRGEVLNVWDAGPYTPGGSPSDAGKIVRVAFVRCGRDAAGDPIEEVDDATDCCDWSGGLIGSPSGSSDPVPGSSLALQVFPPRGGAKWHNLRTPAPRRRFPATSGVAGTLSVTIDYDQSATDPTFGGKMPGEYVVYDVPLGRVVDYLRDTRHEEWDVASHPDDGDLWHDYEVAALVRFGGYAGFIGDYKTTFSDPLWAEADLDFDVETGTQGSGGSKPLVEGVRVTQSECCDCCGCSPAEEAPGYESIAVAYAPGEEGDDIVCTYTGSSQQTTSLGSGATIGGCTTVRTYKTRKWNLVEPYDLTGTGGHCGAENEMLAILGGPSYGGYSALEFRGVRYGNRELIGYYDGCDSVDPYPSPHALPVPCQKIDVVYDTPSDEDPECNRGTAGAGDPALFYLGGEDDGSAYPVWDDSGDIAGCEDWPFAPSEYEGAAPGGGTTTIEGVGLSEYAGSIGQPCTCGGFLFQDAFGSAYDTCDNLDLTEFILSYPCRPDLPDRSLIVPTANVMTSPPSQVTIPTGEWTAVETGPGSCGSSTGSGPVAAPDPSTRIYATVVTSCVWCNTPNDGA